MILPQLESKLALLQSALETSESTALAKAGEVSVVRSNIAKSQREHERHLQSLQAHHNEEKERYERELDALKAEMEQLRTRIMFLNNDYEEVVRKNKALEKSATTASNTNTFGGFIGGERGGTASPSITPKRKKIMTHRDGFDDDEIMIMGSPRGGRTKTVSMVTTPSKKRKRITVDSPVNAVLPLSQSRRTPAMEGSARRLHLVDEEILKGLWKEDGRFDFYEAIMSHRSEISNVRALEELSKCSFPSNPATTLSSMFIDNISKLNTESPKEKFPVIVCKSLLSIWWGILKEKFWTPFPHLLDLLHFSLMYSHGSACTSILDDAVDLLQRTIDVNAIAIFKRDLDKLVPEIDVDRCLTVLEFIALNSLSEEQYARRFWKLIRIDFVLMCLNPNQPLATINALLSLLCTSIFMDSFGPQLSNSSQQSQNELHTLEAVTRILVETPDLSAVEMKMRRERLVEVRKGVVGFLGCVVAAMEGGGKRVVESREGLARLVKRVAEEVEALYDFRGGVGRSVDLINTTVRLLHSLLTANLGIQLGTRLTGGATHKHIVAMTRLAFSEGLLQEAGIEEEVVELAHAILEMSVTPEEGEVLQELFTGGLRM
ncbi:hypothetical protein BDZ91DRAFT_653093 [Kalaharituber pfeilii]|nr:hypothetical protein BDZ91DRAFT_653093 [Kalaharituber pfeilii]